MNRNANYINGRLSLRQPQRESLEILARLTDIVNFSKEVETTAALDVIRSEYPNVTDFERDFPSLCFALATGVGKTRLMGAFIAYLFLEKRFRHFFVLAPNLTIYNKLIADFSPNSAKYVFQGLAEFAAEPPEVITGDNYENGRGVRAANLFGETGVHINIFNISKINSETRGGREPRIKRLSEYIGESYFDYLANLDDLVLLMDESHRYRASAGVRVLNELKPILGLELTATPQIETGSNTIAFKNVVYRYPLSKALEDGFVKEPAVATRENFIAANFNAEQLERLKLEDAVRIHENTKVDLETYARQNEQKIVKPFMLIIARDTEHAGSLMTRIKDPIFFGGRYAARVITIHSNQRGEEADETVNRLLAVENPDEPTEIVIHVNMLKEGWDVTNLYTIVPLRAANSRTLVEQSIGRGLRLPYAKKTGVAAVDRLTIVAHDRFQDIIDEANRPDSVIRVVPIFIEKIIEAGKVAVTVEPVLNQLFNAPPAVAAINSPNQINNQASGAISNGELAQLPQQQRIQFENPIERRYAQTTLEVIKRFERLPRSGDLARPDIQAEIVQAVKTAYTPPAQAAFVEVAAPVNIEKVVAEAINLFVKLSLDIPKIVVVPSGAVQTGYKDFNLDVSNINLYPFEQNIMFQELRTNERSRLLNQDILQSELQPENYLVRALIDYEDISYDDHANLLYKLAGQAVTHLRSYLPDEAAVTNVLRNQQKQLADVIRAQMLEHHWEAVAGYETTISRGFTTLRPNNYTIAAGESVRNFRAPITDLNQIRQMQFGEFRKCLYSTQKFDSDPERRFAVALEDDATVQKWFKPAKGQFQIYWNRDQAYEPDFVVETSDAKFLCEPKRADLMQDREVLAKAHAAALWCEHATAHELTHYGKQWLYLLIPHNAINSTMSLSGLAAAYRFG